MSYCQKLAILDPGYKKIFKERPAQDSQALMIYQNSIYNIPLEKERLSHEPMSFLPRF